MALTFVGPYSDQLWSNLFVLVWLLLLPLASCSWMLGITKRLTALLIEPGGELAELALLPGAGSAQEHGRVVLRETLMRRLAWGAPLLAGLVAGYAAVLGRVHAPAGALLSGVLLGLGIVLLYATVTWVSLPASSAPQFGRALGSLAWASYSVRRYLRADRSFPITQGLAWLLPLGPPWLA